jgi:pyruvate formate lyase activating enzyme
MKGLVFDIRSFSVHDGPGIRKTVFLKGCPLRCIWCHNPESQGSEPASWVRKRKSGNYESEVIEALGRFMSVEEVMKEILDEVPFFEESAGGVTLSGGEPLSQADFAAVLLSECKKHHIHTAIDTCGHVPWEEFEKILPFTDLFLYDLKLISSADHEKYTGYENRLILNNLRKLYDNSKKIIVRIPLVEGVTDTEENLSGLKQLLKDLPSIDRVDLLPFHNIANNKFIRLGMEYPLKELPDYPDYRAREIQEAFASTGRIVSVGG